MSLRRWLPILAAWLAVSIPVWGQPPANDPLKVFHAPVPAPSYDVATIKPGVGGVAAVAIGGAGQARSASGGGQTVFRYILTAYGLPRTAEMRVIGGPAWLRNDPYVIQSKLSDEQLDSMQKMTRAEQQNFNRSLQQSLLQDRFKLKVHFETRELPVYELVAAKGGLKVKPASDPLPGTGSGRPFPSIGVSFNKQGEIAETYVPATNVSTLIDTLMNQGDVGGRPILDKTGFSGTFEVVTLKWTPDSVGAALFTALDEALGMKLVPGKAQVEVVVIDSIERPTEN